MKPINNRRIRIYGQETTIIQVLEDVYLLYVADEIKVPGKEFVFDKFTFSDFFRYAEYIDEEKSYSFEIELFNKQINDILKFIEDVNSSKIVNRTIYDMQTFNDFSNSITNRLNDLKLPEKINIDSDAHEIFIKVSSCVEWVSKRLMTKLTPMELDYFKFIFYQQFHN